MTVVTGFSNPHVASADAAGINVPSCAIWIALGAFAVLSATFLANPLWILVLFKDGIVVVTILVPVGLTVS
jgi:hypothetical protein